MDRILILLIIFPLSLYSQQITIKGAIKDNQNRSITSASVLIIDNREENLGYDFSDENGNFSISLDKPETEKITIEVSCLGFHKKTLTISVKSNTIQNFILEDKTESLHEVVIEANQKIKIDNDTTTIKVAGFGNKTEQTLEDVLKKLPGIEVQKDGTIKAHGKTIDKLLVEGEDMFDKNYKLLSKNLDAKVLDAVQIIDGFEDNPILKKLDNSDKVALNIKLKKGKKNIWFGNLTLGSGIVSENRWKEGINLGLLRKKIKLFYLGDYNNSGEKASDQIATNIRENASFGEDRIEKKAKTTFSIYSNENQFFSKSQSVFNTAFLNSASINSKINSKLKLRFVLYFANDKQIQKSLAETNFNLGTTNINLTENKGYFDKKTFSFGEIELKYFTNENNYITNLIIYKNNPYNLNDNLFSNSNQIIQSSIAQNQTFYNHFNHTYQLSNNKVLHNYIYFGNDKIVENNNINSPALALFLNSNNDAIINQNSNNKLNLIGIKSKIISKFRNIDHELALQFEKSNETFQNSFLINNINNRNYENNLKLNQIKSVFDNIIRYNFSKKIDFTANISLQNNLFKTQITENKIFLINPNFSLNIKKTGFGNFLLSYTENNTLPDINQLTTNNQLSDYRSFSKGTLYYQPLKNSISSFNYYFYNDEKRFSINTSILYIKSHSIFNTESTLNNDFNFANYKQTTGGNSYNFYFSFVNYIRKLKLASKIETTQMWSSTPVNINSTEFLDARNYNTSYKYSGTTYFNIPINFDFGFNYNYYEAIFNNITTSNITKDAFVNINYKISKTCIAEFNNTFYELNNTKYSFINTIINYTPIESRFSYRLILNNLTNENEFTTLSINNYSTAKYSINLVPRYLLVTLKYRF